MKIDTWTGCYPSDWRGKIVPDAITHPAKYSSKLIRRIYEHMIEEGWLQPGDLVIDPFGGVALGALDAMRLGLRWRGCELEPRFADLGNQNIGLWNSRYCRMPHWCTDATLFQGDSRNLLAVLETAGGSVSSPPYAESIGNAEKSGIDWGKQLDRETNHPHGWNGESYSAAGALSSPPYADSMEKSNGIDVNKLTGNKAGLTSQALMDPRYSAAGALSSPPYAEARIGLKSGQEQCGRGDQYGATPGQLGAMKAGGFDGALASPPFRQTSGGTGETAVGRGDPNLLKRHAAGNAAAHGYGETEGQLANMGDGDFDAAVSSPPYLPKDDRRVAWGATMGKTLEDMDEERGYKRNGSFRGYYSMDPANLGNPTGANQDDFWMAARQIVEQVYIALRPGAHVM